MNRQGFTLIELCLAILVFSLGILGVAKMQTYAVQGTAFSMQLTNAINVAEDQIEQLSGQMLRDELGQANVPANLAIGNQAGAATVAQGVTYTPTWVVSQYGNGLSRRVDLTVSWMEKSQPHALNLSFIIGQE